MTRGRVRAAAVIFVEAAAAPQPELGLLFLNPHTNCVLSTFRRTSLESVTALKL
jgi:hypothetical protein